MKNYFKIKPRLDTLEQNKINGKSAERYFAALLTIALEARVFWGTRTEDDSKVDLMTVLNHPWLENRVEVIFTQVKSGLSYCEIKNKRLVVHKDKFSHLTKRNHNTLVCWSTVNNNCPYWFIIKANSSYFRTTYSEIHILNPASRFDIIRILTSTAIKNGGKGLIFKRENSRQEYSNQEFISLRVKAKRIFNDLKISELYNPLFGKIEFTRLGWRHMTRASRLNNYKIASYEIIPILKFLLSKTPSKHYLFDYENKNDKENEYRYNEYLMEYDNVKCYDNESGEKIEIKIYVKLLELIGYNKNWRDVANTTTETNRRVIFKSIYYKTKRNS
jgi:hypothetical protein